MTKTHELAPTASGPLAGVRIIDMTTVVLGAYATCMLGDMGADVVKVETAPNKHGVGGDIMRWAGKSPSGKGSGMGPIFMTINRNKRSITLDLKQEDDLAVLKDLLKTADVFTTNVRMQGLERLGLSYDDVKALKSDIVYVHAAGYGSDGPYAGYPAYDDLIQATSGYADIQSLSDGKDTPRFVPTLVADKGTGQMMAQSTLAALFHKERSGEGQFVEVPMLETMSSIVLAEHFYGEVYEPATGKFGYTRVTAPNRKPYKTKDGYIGIMPYSDNQWNDFFELGGRGRLLEIDDRFTSYEARTTNINLLYEMVEEVALQKSSDEWLTLLRDLDIPAMPVNRLQDLKQDPHMKAVDFFQLFEHPTEGAYWNIKPPVKFSESPSTIHRHPPKLGEHTQEVLSEAGIESAVIEKIVGRQKPKS